MSNSQTILSINIPTYNRSSYLKEAISSVVAQIDKYNLHDEVDILISDNHSTDNTEEVVKKFLHSKTNIRYSKNSENIGIIKNFIKCIEDARGQFVMVYGDDDILVEDSLPKILENIKNHPKVPVTIYKSVETDYVTLQEPELLSMGDAAEKYFYYIGNAGIFLVNTSLARENIEKYRSRIETSCWPQTEVMFLAMQQSKEKYPLLVSPVESASSPIYEEIRVFNSWYLIETTYFALLRVAFNLSQQLGKNFIARCAQGTPNVAGFYNFVKTITMYTAYFDTESELENTKKLSREAFSILRGKYKAQALLLLLIVYLPKGFKKAINYILKFAANPFSSKKNIAANRHYIERFMETKKRVYASKGKMIDIKGGIS
jgi:glycosyltransferase involved in cell wall biosynthesis